jgi:hypothetical protein
MITSLPTFFRPYVEMGYPHILPFKSSLAIWAQPDELAMRTLPVSIDLGSLAI